jgi:hypothetical protein
LKDSIEVICLHWKNGYYFFQKFHYLVQFVLLFKIEKKVLKNLYCTCEPFLYVKDDNHVDKEYEEANEQSVVVERWGYTWDAGQGGHFHTIDQEGLTTLHVVE